MKYRIVEGKSKENPFKAIRDPEGEDKTIGIYATFDQASVAIRDIVLKKPEKPS